MIKLHIVGYLVESFELLSNPDDFTGLNDLTGLNNLSDLNDPYCLFDLKNTETTWNSCNEGFFDLSNISNLIGLHSLNSLCGLNEAISLFLEETGCK